MSEDRKLAAENWKIIQDLKEESRQLKKFGSDLELSLKSEDIEHGISVQPNQYTSPSFIDKSGSSIKIENYCNSSTCKPSHLFNNLLEQSEKQSTFEIGSMSDESADSFTSSVKIPREKSRENKIPSSITAVLHCFLNFPRFKDFIIMVSAKFDEDAFRKKFPTILFLKYAVDSLAQPEAMDLLSKKFEALYESMRDEPVSIILASMLELLHEELMQAKNEGILTQVCINGCKLGGKLTHTVVSHLFHGRLQRKIFCVCGYHKVLDETFCDISIPVENIVEKSLMIHYVSDDNNSDHKLNITKFLFSVNQWSTVKTLFEKLIITLESKRKQQFKTSLSHCSVNKEDIAVFSLVGDQLPMPLVNNMKLFDIICEDGELWAFDTSIGDLSLNLQSLSLNNFDDDNVDNVNNNNSKLSSNISHLSKNSDGYVSGSGFEADRNKSHSALVFVQLIWSSMKMSVNLVLRFPKICHGLHILERLSRIIGISHTDFPSLVLIGKNKSGICILCLNENCEGCRIHHNDKVVLSQHYCVSVMMSAAVTADAISIKDDDSVLANEHIDIFCMNEALLAFNERCEIDVCPACLQKNWLLSETTFLKCPIIMIIHFPLPLKENQLLSYPMDKFRPLLRKKGSKTDYSLLSIVLHDGLHSVVYNNYNDKNKSDINNIPFLRESDAKPHTPSQMVEMLIYEKVKSCSSTTDKLALNNSKIGKRVRNKQKKMFVKTKFSPRTGSVTKQFSHRKDTTTTTTATPTSGYFGRRCSHSPSHQSTCNCTQCVTLHRVHSQVYSARSSAMGSISVTDSVAVKKVPSEKSFMSYASSSTEGFSPEYMLHKAVRDKDLKGAVEWLEKGADVNFVLSGMGLLHLSAAMDPPFGKVFSQLCLDHGADPNLAGKDGLRPIHIAIMWEKEESLKLIIDAGGLPSHTDRQGRNAFDILIETKGQCSENMLKILQGKEDKILQEGVEKDNIGFDIDEVDMSLLHMEDQRLLTDRRGVPEELIQHPTASSSPICYDNNFSGANTSFLHESLVIQNFTEEDESAFSFPGSEMNWFSSFLSCSAQKLRKMRKKGIGSSTGASSASSTSFFRRIRSSLSRSRSRVQDDNDVQ